METTNCNLCGSGQYKTLFTLHKFKIPVTIVQCARCGLMYQNPRPERAAMDSLYSQDYYTGKADISYMPDVTTQKSVSEERLKIIETLKPPGALLDVGCHSGIFLEAANERGWNTYGVDVSPFIVGKAKERGLNVIQGEIQDIRLESNFFDVVTMYEVIEHFRDPLSTLRELHRIMKDDGMLIIQTANMHSLRVKLLNRDFYSIPLHLYYFTRKSISEMLKKADCEIIRIFNGSEFGLSTEIKLFKNEVPLVKLLLRKLLNRITLFGYTFNSSMVIYARKATRIQNK